MTSDFEKVTAAKTGEIEKYIQPPSGTKEIEQHLRKNHRLKYGLAQVRYLFDPDFFRRDAIDFQKLVQSLSQKNELEFRCQKWSRLQCTNRLRTQRQRHRMTA